MVVSEKMIAVESEEVCVINSQEVDQWRAVNAEMVAGESEEVRVAESEK